MKTDPNKSLAQNILDVFRKLQNNSGRRLKEWEEHLIRQAEDDLKKEKADES